MTQFQQRNRIGERWWFPRNAFRTSSNLPEPCLDEMNQARRYDLQVLYVEYGMSIWQIAEYYDRLESDVRGWLDAYELHRPLKNYRRSTPDDYRRDRVCIVDVPIGSTRWGVQLMSMSLLECGHRSPSLAAPQHGQLVCAVCRRIDEGS
jgi:hypothetical protein